MHDIKYIRENPEAFDAGLAKRGIEPKVQDIINLDETVRRLQTDLQELLTKRNQLAKEIGQAKAKGEDVTRLMAVAGNNNAAMTHIEQAVPEGKRQLEVILEILPNLPADDVPTGKDEHTNQLVKTHGEKPVFTFTPKEHFDIGEGLGLLDFERAAKIAGTRFSILKGQLARLERALVNFMLDMHTQEFGYTEVIPPFLVRANALYGTGQLPKFEEDLFKTTTEHYLIPTAEVPLTNIYADEIVLEKDLPVRFAAYTPCFRSEAGSAGRDTRGMIRQHQFTKVEMVSIVAPEKSAEEHERMLGCAEAILQRLGLHYRVMLLCSGDMGFSAQKTYDIEVWLPGQNNYREISSCSNCGDFQMRRMKTRYRPEGSKNTRFPHSLNGSGLPLGRTIVALLENYQQEDGSVLVPEALQPYMNGVKVMVK